MDLWIRSQDKKRLVHAYGCEVVEALDGWKIREYATNDYVGKYKTEKRAIEVLDEIQDSMYDTYETMGRDGNVLVRHIQPKQDNFIVYQMPSDDEVKA